MAAITGGVRISAKVAPISSVAVSSILLSCFMFSLPFLACRLAIPKFSKFFSFFASFLPFFILGRVAVFWSGSKVPG